MTAGTVKARPLTPGAAADADATARRSPLLGDGIRYRSAWSPGRLSAAVAAALPPGARPPVDGLLDDELEFFASIGVRSDLAHGTTLIDAGQKIQEVHLIVQGAAAVVSDRGGRRPILAFALPNELCCPVPVLLHERALWGAVTVTDSTVITVEAAQFSAAVRDRWVDRWSTRSLSWLASMGARSADLDCDLTGQTGALLLRHRWELPVALCRQTIADLLDAGEESVEAILFHFELLGAVRLRNGRMAVTQVETLKSTVAAARRQRARGLDPLRITR
jgi:CRP-like cAMP-binding protein